MEERKKERRADKPNPTIIRKKTKKRRQDKQGREEKRREEKRKEKRREEKRREEKRREEKRREEKKRKEKRKEMKGKKKKRNKKRQKEEGSRRGEGGGGGEKGGKRRENRKKKKIKVKEQDGNRGSCAGGLAGCAPDASEPQTSHRPVRLFSEYAVHNTQHSTQIVSCMGNECVCACPCRWYGV
jgi:hypothetical protein